MSRGVPGIALAGFTVISGLTFIGERARGDLRADDLRPAATAQLAQSDWSAPVDGVRGRLIASPIESAGRPQFRLELELENVSDQGTPIEMWWTGLYSMLELRVEDETGRALPAVEPPGYGHQPGPFWLPLMHQSSVRVVVTSRAYEYGADDRVFLRPILDQAWILTRSSPPSRLFIRGVLRPREEPERRERAWRGPLTLPRIEIPSAIR